MERAAGYGRAGVRVGGNDVLQVYAAAGDAVRRGRDGGGRTLIEATTYRWREHVEHNKGIMSRSAKELLYWKARCPIARFRNELTSYGEHPSSLAAIEQEIHEEVDEAFRFAEASPSPSVAHLMENVGDAVEVFDEPQLPLGTRSITCTEAIAEATVQAMDADLNVFVVRLHVDDPNGVFGTTTPAFKKFGHARVFETPISEASATGILGGAAIMGMRPLHVHARNDFLLLCMSQFGNELTKWCYMSAGALTVPLVIRAIVGRSRGQGCQHSQSLQALFAHFPGLHVVAPSNGYDAKGLLLTALSGKTPVVFLEHRLCHPMTTVVPEASYRIPFGKARIVRQGTDVTIVSVLQMVYEAECAAGVLAKLGVSAEVIDLRSIRPWDKAAVCASVVKTGRLIVADTGWTEFGISAEIAATITENVFGHLKAPPTRIALPPCPTPMAEPLETAYYPGSRDIVAHALRFMDRKLPRDLQVSFATKAIAGPF